MTQFNWKNLLNNSTVTGTAVSVFDEFDMNIHPEVKKYEVVESPEDILALSVCWKRYREQGVSPAAKLLDRALFEKLTQEDRDKADVIRDYYSKKLMMIKLTGDGNLSKYRTDLSKFLHSERNITTSNLFGLIYYLPVFYDYDIELDHIKSQFATTCHNKSGFKTDNLTPIKKINRKSAKINHIQYWFKNSNDNGVYVNVSYDNQLLNVWDHTFSTNKVLKIEGSYIKTKLDTFEHFKLDKWKILYD